MLETMSIVPTEKEKEIYRKFEDAFWRLATCFRNSIATDNLFLLFGVCLIYKKYGILSQLEIENLTHESFANDVMQGVQGMQGQKTMAVSLSLPLIVLEPISEISPAIIVDVINEVMALDEFELEVYGDRFISLFEYLFDRIPLLPVRQHTEYSQPIELTRLMCSLSVVPENGNVFNPFAGLGSTCCYLPQGVYYRGQEINRKVASLANLRSLVWMTRGGIKIVVNEDSIEKFYDGGKKSYDLIISNPPFNLKVYPYQDPDTRGTIKTVEDCVIADGLSILNKDGQIILVVPNRFLFSENFNRSLKKRLIDDDLLDMVISFPSGLLKNTPIGFAVVVIRKNKKEAGTVKFVNAENYVEKISKRSSKIDDVRLIEMIKSGENSESIRVVPNKKIAEFDYNLTIGRYFFKELIVTPGAQAKKLGDFMSPVQIQKSQNLVAGKFVRIRDLRDDRLNFALEVSMVELSELPKQVYEVKESALLLALRWNTLKPTFFDYSGESIFINSDIFAVKLDETQVDRGYLINELFSDDFTLALQSIKNGAVVPTIRKSDVLELQIVLPPLQEQRAKVDGIKESMFQEKKKELELWSKINGLENEIYEQNTFLRHSLAGPALNLRGSIKSLRNILLEQVEPNVPGLLEYKERIDSLLNLGKFLSILERDINKISATIGTRTTVNDSIRTKNLAPIEILSFVENYVREYRSKNNMNFDVTFYVDVDSFVDYDGEKIKPYINGNADLLMDLFDNVVKNAEVHAFNGFDWIADLPGGVGSPVLHKIEFHIMPCTSTYIENENGVTAHENAILISISNNGLGFPENFDISDFGRKGSKAGINAGDGFGGWYIKEIVKKLNGAFDIIDERGPEGVGGDWATSFEFTFPVIQIDTDENI